MEKQSKVVHLTYAEKVYGLKMVHFYRRHPVLAVRDILGLPVTSPHFRIALKAAWFSDHTVLLLSRGMMKSTTIAIVTILKALLYPNRVQLPLGPQFRQGKMILEEAGVEKILTDRMGRQVHRRGFANHSCVKPTQIINKGLNDLWKVKFKNGSQIVTGPLGKKGDSLLGTRANDIYLDEMRDFNRYQVTKVIQPFANVFEDPFSTNEDAAMDRGNTFLYSGTIRYTDDYYYEIIDEYRKKMVQNQSLLRYGFCPRIGRGTYAVVEFNYEDAFKLAEDVHRPEQITVDDVIKWQEENKIKFFFRVNIEEIEALKESDTVSKEDWYAENKNFPIKLGSKEFPYILLQTVSDLYEIDSKDIPNSHLIFPELLGEKWTSNQDEFVGYIEPLLSCTLPCVAGIDIGTESDKFACTIIRPGTVQGNMFDNIAYSYAESHLSYAEILNRIYDLVDRFMLARIHMDLRGGGTAVRDMLRDQPREGRPVIVDMKSDPKAAQIVNRLDMLRMINATPEYNTTIVNMIKAKMQAKKLLMPKIISIHPDPDKNRVYRDLLALRSQFGKIKARPIGGGWKKFYVPETKSSDESLEKGFKDLFSSTLYAVDALMQYTREMEESNKRANYKCPMPTFIEIGTVVRN